MATEPDWLKKARETHHFHREQCLSHSTKWTITKTASLLRRSFGSVAEDLMLVRWSKSYDLSQFEYAFEALNFIRMKKKEQDLGE